MTQDIVDLVALVWAQKQTRGLLLLLDYDGTLVEIAPRPELAQPPPELLEILERLVVRPGYAVFVVSGRPLKELQELLPGPGLNYIGSHGGEGQICGEPWVLKAENGPTRELEELQRELACHLSGRVGWWLETKSWGFALHYRQADPEQETQIMAALTPWMDQVSRQGCYQVLRGKKVVEILPQGISKGAAIQAILAMHCFSGFFPIYFGDDHTDESAFQILKGRGLSVKVGEKGPATAAGHFLAHPPEVRQFLSKLASYEEKKGDRA